ncbi:unnamed protein product [Discosporangium mesarthrocarpum]
MTPKNGPGPCQATGVPLHRTSTPPLPPVSSQPISQNPLEEFSNSRSHLAAVDRCLDAICELVHFEIAEVWTYVGGLEPQDGKAATPRCLHTYVKPATVLSYMGVLGRVWNEDNNSARHKLSPILVKQARQAEGLRWFTSEHPDTPLHEDLPLNTAVALPISLDAFHKDLCFVFFSDQDVNRYDTAVMVLEQLSRAAGYAVAASFPAYDKEGREEAVTVKLSSMTLNTLAQGVASESVDAGETPAEGPPINEDVRWDELTNVEFMVNGSRCTIYTAFYGNIPVVVKLVRIDAVDKDLIKQELELEMRILMRLNHPNIVRIFGGGSHPERFILIERLDGGTLAQRCGNALAVRDRRRRFRHKQPFTYEELLKRGMQLAEGLQYMHNDAIPGKIVVHRDLKPDNIAFDASGNLKLIDMGLSKVVTKKEEDNAVYMMTGETGSLRYMAPEVALGKPYNGSADVYSFSMILWEMATMTKPFEALDRNGFMRDVVMLGVRPHISKNWPPEFARLLMDCWDVDMHKRLSFTDIITRLDGMLQEAANKAAQVKHAERNPKKKFGGLFQTGSKKGGMR